MVKVKVISRSTSEWTKERSGEVPRANRNYDPNLNPMAQQQEYTRAVRSAKLNRMFAKPFLGALSGHHDTVQCIGLDPGNLGMAVSGGADGEVVLWNMGLQKQLLTIPNAHQHFVSSVCVTPDSSSFLSSSKDKTVKLWDLDWSSPVDASEAVREAEILPVAQYLSEYPLSCLDHHRAKSQFVTAGTELELWDTNRTQPIQRFNWGMDTVTKVRFNPTETELVACCFSDRGVGVYDTRTQNAHSKIIMELRANAVSWNPMNPNMFVTGNDDWNCYLFDLRFPTKPRSVFQGFIHPVTDVDFSPTGTHFVAGSEDCTLRTWDVHRHYKSSSDEVYHTKRMAKVHCVRWSLDNNYLFSGSEDAIVRVWKADASKPVRPLFGQEETKYKYMKQLARDRYSQFDEVRRIARQKNLPKVIIKTDKRKRRVQKREIIKEINTTRSGKPTALKKKKVIERVV